MKWNLNSLGACYCALKEKVESLVDKDEQQLSSDGCEISLTNGGSVKLQKTVYYWETGTEGVLEEIWSGGGNSAPHDNVSNIFTGTTHVNGAPDISVVVPDWNDSTSNDPSNGTDQFQYTGYIYIPADGTQIQDVNANTGERLRALVGKGCCPPVVTKEVTVNTPSSDRGLGIFATLDEGWHKIIFQGSDLSAFGGVQIQIDDAGNGVFANYTGPTSLEKPTLACKTEDCDYVLADGEYDCIPSMDAECDPIDIKPGGLDETAVVALIDAQDHDDPEPQTALANLESDNNESEGSWNRAGNVGTSDLYAREDHQHPIIRIPNPGDPVMTVGGNFTLLQSIILDRGSNEEEYWYRFRVRVSQAAGTGWGWVQVPTIAGFQQPIFSEVGGYMNPSIAVQDDDGSFGASPRGPWMGYPIHHWSSTNRLYGGFFRRDNDVNSVYVNFVVKYTRS